MTQLESARAGVLTQEVLEAAQSEPVEAEALRQLIAQGQAVLPRHKNRPSFKYQAIGRGLRTKVNANLGTSGECADMEMEEAKLQAALRAGTHSLMDLSTGGDLEAIRAFFLEHSPVMVGAVPIYGISTQMVRKGKPLEEMQEEELFRSIDEQCRQGLDYITVHCGVTREAVRRLESYTRIMPCVSRGGSILMYWMRKTGRENPLYEHFDELLEIAHRYDVTLSLGDGFRPGSVLDATDGPQIEELMILGELARRARAKGVQVMIEGPGHVPLQDISSHMMLEKRLCDGAPFYVLGPLPTDIAPGYDHITSAIGGAIAGAAGADFLCYVTPAEHLCLPNPEDVFKGVMAARIAAHVADIAKGLPGALEQDRRMSVCRQQLDWEGMIRESIDPELTRRRLQIAQDREGCSMCGKLCAVKLSRQVAPGGI